MKSPFEFVELKDGPTLPVTVVDLAIDLEARGFTMRADGEKLWVGSPTGKLTQDDMETIRSYKMHFLALVSYLKTR